MNTIDDAYIRYIDKRFLPLPTEAQVAALERRIDVVFPDDYRQFLLEYNGGYFLDPQIEPTSEDCPLDALNFLHGIGALHDGAELGDDSDMVLFDDNDPPKVVVIGSTAMGGLIILATRPDEDRGVICLKKAFGDWYFLADNLAGFFELLREPFAAE